MIGLILYFVIGAILGFSYYAWECYKYKKKYEDMSWKLTWDEYSTKEEVGMGCIFALFLWPFCILAMLLWLSCTIPAKYIRKYFGIE